MKLTRRDLVLGTAAASATGLTPIRLFGQPATVIRKPIPSSGEMLPVIGLGTARRYQEVTSDADLLPLRETLRKFREVGATVIDTAPVYGTAEEVVGRILDEEKLRPGLFLATKVSISGGEAGITQSNNPSGGCAPTGST